jgi:hypothetical protein
MHVVVDHDLPALTWAIPVDTTGEVEDPGNIAMSKNPGEMLAASDLISVLSVLDSNVISGSNMTYDALEDGASRKTQCTKGRYSSIFKLWEWANSIESGRPKKAARILRNGLKREKSRCSCMFMTFISGFLVHHGAGTAQFRLIVSQSCPSL